MRNCWRLAVKYTSCGVCVWVGGGVGWGGWGCGVGGGWGRGFAACSSCKVQAACLDAGTQATHAANERSSSAAPPHATFTGSAPAWFRLQSMALVANKPDSQPSSTHTRLKTQAADCLLAWVSSVSRV